VVNRTKKLSKKDLVTSKTETKESRIKFPSANEVKKLQKLVNQLSKKWMRKEIPVRQEIIKSFHLSKETNNFGIPFPSDFIGGYKMRDWYINNFSFALPCKEAIQLIKKYSPLVEIGAGSGFWAKIMKNSGVDVVATNFKGDSAYKLNSKRYCKVLNYEASNAVRLYKERNVFISWACYGKGWSAKAFLN